ncbi:MAG: ABC transporter ATP-binding protein [Candidatus Hydrogenedentes bacterium]|nr:ABC transporter ATP-binding protein [Candidatus Hydrogenedentota bacterium]
MSIVIKAEGLSKWFGEVVAVNNLDLEIAPGVTGLLGPNGAGKSTFIKLALGLYGPSRGYIHVFGKPPRNNLDVLRRIGYCPETDMFPDSVTGYEFVYWMNRFWGMDGAAAQKRAEEVCDIVKISARMDDLIVTYSRGMRQRIKLAQALAVDPDLLFLDEPMAGLDPEGREELFELIRGLGAQGKTVIMSSHILHEIARATHNVVLLHNGSILARGHVHDIRELIDEHPHTVTVECSAPRKVAEQFTHDRSTLAIEFTTDAVTIRTSDPNAFYQKLNTYVLEEPLEVHSISCPDDNLQAVFDYLLKK